MRYGCTCQAGFTLMEVMVAMVLIAAIGMASYGWINTSLISLGRIQDHNVCQQATRNALAFMESFNPMERPTGEAEMGPCLIRWDSHLVEPPKDGIGYPLGTSLYRLGLYDIHVRIEQVDGGEIAVFELRQVGFHQIHEFSTGF